MRALKVLIVEDEFLFVLELTTRLEALGYLLCAPVASAEEALAVAAAERPDVAVIDIHLVGGTSGLELAAVLSERYRMPFLFMTGHADETTRRKIEALKPLAFLIKPIHAEDIHRALKATGVWSG